MPTFERVSPDEVPRERRGRPNSGIADQIRHLPSAQWFRVNLNGRSRNTILKAISVVAKERKLRPQTVNTTGHNPEAPVYFCLGKPEGDI